MPSEVGPTAQRLDLLWLLFLLVLALLPPIGEIHKQEILVCIGIFQLLEARIVAAVPERGAAYAVLIKIGLATILINHTGEVSGINSSYYPIYYLPVMTAAMYFGPWATLFWTTLASGAYCSYLYWALQEAELNRDAVAELSLRMCFFFLVAMTVNRFVMGYREQTQRYQAVAETLTHANEDLKKAQAEARRAERLAALGQLSAGLAHEIRNPLGVIKGSAEILNQKLAASDALAKELSGYIYTEVNRLSALVGRFLDFARPSRLELRPLELQPTLEKALKSVSEQIDISKINVRRDYATNLPPVMADEQLCDQVFTNLLTNACEAMNELGGGELTIRARRQDSGSRHEVVVEIEDTGPGIPADLKEQIFNPFFTTKKTGVGLGLAIVTKIIDAHGGAVRVRSEPGQGACFQICFPQAENLQALENKELQIH
ncbi:MAG TPA: ATP-binding protein [Candidatus Angelobacter sp.]|nr:ATP-binding protein [Candidatus Angelobacter sp.]